MGADRPDETEAQRADRNFGELLQELRVVQTGVQILFASMLTLPFQQVFQRLSAAQRHVYIAAVLLAVGAVICLTAPVAYHRALFRLRLKDEIVTIASRFAVAGLAFLGSAITLSVGLVMDVALGRGTAISFVSLVGLGVLVIWLALPLATRLRHRRALAAAVPATQPGRHPGRHPDEQR